MMPRVCVRICALDTLVCLFAEQCCECLHDELGEVGVRTRRTGSPEQKFNDVLTVLRAGNVNIS